MWHSMSFSPAKRVVFRLRIVLPNTIFAQLGCVCFHCFHVFPYLFHVFIMFSDRPTSWSSPCYDFFFSERSPALQLDGWPWKGWRCVGSHIFIMFSHFSVLKKHPDVVEFSVFTTVFLSERSPCCMLDGWPWKGWRVELGSQRDVWEAQCLGVSNQGKVWMLTSKTSMNISNEPHGGSRWVLAGWFLGCIIHVAVITYCDLRFVAWNRKYMWSHNSAWFCRFCRNGQAFRFAF